MMLETPAEILAHEASADAVRSFLAWRKMTKKPLTERAALLILKTLREITAAGGDADEALDLVQEHGWPTIKPDWYWRIKHGNRRAIPNGSGYGPDPASQQILRIAGVGAASGDDRA